MRKEYSVKTTQPHSSFKEFLELIWVGFKVQVRSFMEFLKVAYHYYSNLTFCKIDLSLLISYLFNSPYEISKSFLTAKGEKDVYTYGETPLTTLETIAKQCQISAKDTVFELGCGRGRTSFWLNAFIGCKVVGIEHIPEFVANANAIKTKFHVTDVEFLQQDMLSVDYTGATVIYLYGSTLDDIFIKKLIARFQNLSPGTKIITISYPLSDYTGLSSFEMMKCFPVQFPWGEADVYLQIKK